MTTTTRRRRPVTVKVARTFSGRPEGRYRRQGPGSGEAFRDDVLRPALERAEARGVRLRIDLDGHGTGYPVDWLEEAFGGLARRVGDARMARLDIVSVEDPELPGRIEALIDETYD